MEVITQFTDFCTYYLGVGGPLFGFFLLVLESFIPMLPLSVFVALNVNAFGLLWGILFSWLGTITGCYLCYLFFYFLSNNFIYKFIGKKTRKKIDKTVEDFKNIKFTTLVLLMTLPFMPSFFLNLLSGIVGISKRKYFAALCIGKFLMITFWAYIGKSFFDSMTDLKTIVFIVIALVVAYVVSKLIGKEMNIE